MITISEVENRGKRSTKSIVAGIVTCALLALPLMPPAFCAETPPAHSATAGDASPDGTSLDKLSDCNWQVTYRGRLYDLSPLTRESLARPIENDIRYVLQRVPESGSRLEEMTTHLHNSRTYTIIASFLLGGFFLAKLLQKQVIANESVGGNVTTDAQNRDTTRFRVAEYGMATFALVGAGLSWRATSLAKRDLVGAVQEFNAHSPYKMEPAPPGRLDAPGIGPAPSPNSSANDGTNDLPTTGTPPAATSPGRN